MAKHLTKRQFLQISRDVKALVKEGAYNAQTIADYHGVHPETVRRVKAAKTWNGFLALKASRQTSPKTSPVEKQVIQNAQKQDAALLKTTAERDEAEEKLATALDELEKRPTRDELEQRFKTIHDRQGTAQRNYADLRGTVSNQGTAIYALIFFAVVTLVIAIVK